MLAPVPIAGVRGMRMLARKVASLPAGEKASAAYIGHIVRMQEEIGTGGAGFRFIYAAFLQEAAALTGRAVLGEFSERLTVIGDGWRGFALRAARMIMAANRSTRRPCPAHCSSWRSRKKPSSGA